MPRKLTPQQYLENIIIQQNKNQTLNQYTALLPHEGKVGFERPDEIMEYGERRSYEDNESAFHAVVISVMCVFTPLVLPLWILLDWVTVNLTGCRNNKSTIYSYNGDGDWAAAMLFTGIGCVVNPLMILMITSVNHTTGGNLSFWGIFLPLHAIGLAWATISQGISTLVALHHFKTLKQYEG